MKAFGLPLLAVLLALPSPGSAQVEDGDLLVAGMGLGQNGQILALDTSRATFTTLLAMKGFNHIVQSVGMAEDNRSWFFTAYDFTTSTGFLARLHKAGAWTTLFQFPGGDGPQAHALDPEGNVLVASRRGFLLEVSPGKHVRTLFKGPTLLNALVVDPRTGRAVVAEYGSTGPARVLEVDPRTGTTATLVPNLTNVRSMAVDVCGNGFLVGRASPPYVYRLQAGKLSTFTSLDMGSALIGAEDGTFFGAGGTGANRALLHVDAQGVLKTTTRVSSLFQSVRALAVHGSRRLGGNSAIQAGQFFNLLLDSRRPQDAFRPYLLLAAFTCNPGWSLRPGVHLALNLDLLSELIIRNALPWAVGFGGNLDGVGSTRPRLLIPKGFKGLTLYLAGAIFDPTRPWPYFVSRVTNTLPVVLP